MNARYQRGDPRYTSTLDEEIEDTKKVTIDEVRQFYSQFYGVGEGEIAIVGQFDPAQIQKLVTELFGDWKSPAHYERIANTYTAVAPLNTKIETPDKQNAVFTASMYTKATDTDPDFPALQIAGYIFGGAPTSRVFTRIRVKDGLSYGASAGFSVPTKDDLGRYYESATAAPQNTPKVEAAYADELAKALKDGFTADEVEKAKKAWFDEPRRFEVGRHGDRQPPGRRRAMGPNAGELGRETGSGGRGANAPAGERGLPPPRGSGRDQHREGRRLQESRSVPVGRHRSAPLTLSASPRPPAHSR